jgi:hypothetical protein
MRHFNKLDWPISLSLLFASVLTVIAACIQPSGPLGAPNVIEVGAVSSVRISLAQSALAPGQTTQATVRATSADGRVVGGRVDFSSQNPSVATVSSQGVVTALVAGAAMIHATVASRADSAAVTVKSLVSPVAVVAVALDSTSLGIGHSAKASATAKDSAGNLITGQTVTWASVSPTVATVSSTGAVTAVAAGSATIQGTVSGKVGSASLTVIQVPALDPLTGVVPPNLSFHDFNDGTTGPYAHTADVDFPDDPTGSGHGKVARMFYNPTQDLLQSSNDEYIAYDAGATHIRYGATIWMKGEFKIPYAGTAVKAGHHRKLIDYWGAGVRMTLYRAVAYSGQLRLWLSCVDWMNGSSQETVTEVTGINLADDTWYTIEVKMVTNSADNIRDGVVEVYINGAASPNYTRNTGLGWITEKYSGGSYFNNYRVGVQLTSDAGQPLYTEYRYWDNVGFSTSRIGR